ncbi:MAG: hypothetical protein PUA51_06780 [Oscillospiraceae bacterium]|nr:hypothetical protein [Oscillospiraceae bacterium]
MTRIKENTVTAINKIVSKGDHVVVTGTTESGKSTGIGFFAESDAVRSLMSMREASGKGSTIETIILATDYKEIPENELIIRSKVLKSHVATHSDDNELLGKVLYLAVRKCVEGCSDENYALQIKTALVAELDSPSNESLAYKLKKISDDDQDLIVQKITAFTFNKMQILLTEAKARFEERGYSAKSKSKVEPRIFRELLSEKREFADTLNEFWECIISLLNKQASELLDKLEAAGAVVSASRDEFTISLGDEDYDSEMANLLLNSENMSMEYLFSDVFFIFRGNKNLYSSQYKNYLAVSEENGEEIHCLSIVDTMGLFHSAGATADEEADRILDLIAKYHSNKLILVVNSDITDTVKDGYDAIKGMLGKINREIEIYIMYTHWDEYVTNEANKLRAGNRRGRMASPIDWNQIYIDSEKAQTELTQSFVDSISSTGKAKPIIVGTYKAALLLGEGARAEEVLVEHDVDYELAIEKIVGDMLVSINRKGPKYRVKDGMAEGCVVTPENKLFDVKKLYRNMVVDCKGHKYWASSVRAVNTKWCAYGISHSSDIKENEYGFLNINSTFVEDMRNFAMGILNTTKSIKIELSGYVVEDDKVKEVEGLVLQYLKDGQNFGKEFAKIIGVESFENGFKRNTGFCYQYERLTDMIQYTQDNFFKGESIRIGNPEATLVIECLQRALNKCVTDFINAKCVEVY